MTDCVMRPTLFAHIYVEERQRIQGSTDRPVGMSTAAQACLVYRAVNGQTLVI